MGCTVSISDITEDGNRWDDQKIAPVFDESVLPVLWLAPAAAPPPVSSGASPRRASLLCSPSGSDNYEWRDPEAPTFTEGALPETMEDGSPDVDDHEAVDLHVLQPRLSSCPFRKAYSMPRPERLAFSWRPVNKCPALSSVGLVLTEARLKALRPLLPVFSRMAKTWRLIYSPIVHGVSLGTFYRQCKAWPGETLVLIEDTAGVVFGGFASHVWQRTDSFHYGMPECFVFRFGTDAAADAEDLGLNTFTWSGKNIRFMHATNRGFAMGGGAGTGGGFAFWVGSDFLRGTSAPSETFGNTEPLASSSEFVIRRFECWSFPLEDLKFPFSMMKVAKEPPTRDPTSPSLSPRRTSPVNRRLISKGSSCQDDEAAASQQQCLDARYLLDLREASWSRD